MKRNFKGDTEKTKTGARPIHDNTNDNESLPHRKKICQSEEDKHEITSVSGRRNLDISTNVLEIEKALSSSLANFATESLKDVTCIYNPLEYASEPHELFLRSWCNSPRKVLFLGMNPGPFGMAQTGVPSGEINHVKDWLGITGTVNKPKPEHPRRPIEGFACKRSEVSGARLWGFLKENFGSPEKFFRNAFVYNYCPLVFMNSSGKNIIPSALPKESRKILFDTCDISLKKLVDLLDVEAVVGIGKFACDRARMALKDKPDVKMHLIMHPSPASPAANKDWAGIVKKQLKESGVWDILSD